QKYHALPFGGTAFQLFPKRSKDCIPHVQLQILVCCGIAVGQHMKPHHAIGNAPLDICRINPRPEDTDQNAPHKGCHPIFPLFFPKGLHTQSPQNQCFHALPPFFSFDGKSITLFLEFYTFFFIGYVPYPAISLHSSPKPANPASFRLLLPSPAPVAD